MEKKWSLKKEEIKELFHWDEPEGCIATDRIMVDGEKVGYMYREKNDYTGDSGWRFLCGDEDNKYLDNTKNSGLYTLNTVVNNDPEIIPFLHSSIGTAFHRDEYGNFIKDNFNVLARQAIDQILYEHNIKDGEDYKNRESYELAEIYENIKIVQEEYHISDDEVNKILTNIFEN